MTTGSVAGVRDFIRKVFPERQIYHRSNGTVHFTVLGPATQIALTCLLFLFLGWVAYASVNVVFKDQIIAAKDARFVSMQKAYESRISKQQLAYDELNGLLTLSEEKFRTSTDELETKFRQIEGMVAQSRKIEEKRGELDQKLETLAGREYLLPPLPRSLSEATQPAAAPEPQADESADTGGPYLPTPAPVPEQSSYAVPASEELLRHAKKNYTAQQLVTIWNRQNNLRAIPIRLMERMMQKTQPELVEQELMISATGLRVEDVVKTSETAEATDDQSGQGGPFVSLGTEAIAAESTGDMTYDQLSANLTSRLDRMSDYTSFFEVVPLTLPIRVANRLSSGFGPRLDPFTKRWAFHAGLDFSGEYGVPVLTTSPGQVVVAERRGPYGNMVEVDSGSGFHTRYGHLNSISVNVGDWVEFQQEVGKVGSTGRSTGPHLHYEIWYDGKVRDPRNFLKVGRYVFEKQG